MPHAHQPTDLLSAGRAGAVDGSPDQQRPTATRDAVHLSTDDGVLTAHCSRCGAYLRRLGPGDDAEARRWFTQAHPDSLPESHRDRVPVGWTRCLSGPGALSQ